MHRLPVKLSRNQFSKLKNGHKIRLTHAHHSHASLPHHLMVHPMVADKARKHHRAKKGIELIITPAEFEASGEGLKEFFTKAYNGVKKVVQSKQYQQIVRPALHQAVNLIPMSAAVRNIVDAVGSNTKAFGIRKGGGKKKSTKKSTKKSKLHQQSQRNAGGKVSALGGSFRNLSI